MSEEQFLAGKYQSLISEIISTNQRLQQLGGEAKIVLRQLRCCKSGVWKGAVCYEEWAMCAASGLEAGGGGIKERNKTRCKWWNRGYCREANGCKCNHPEGDCKEEGCSGQGCDRRHRRRCKYWGSEKGCYRGERCQYLNVDRIEGEKKLVEEKLEHENEAKKIKNTINELEAKLETLEEKNKEANENKIQLNKYR